MPARCLLISHLAKDERGGEDGEDGREDGGCRGERGEGPGSGGRGGSWRERGGRAAVAAGGGGAAPVSLRTAESGGRFAAVHLALASGGLWRLLLFTLETCKGWLLFVLFPFTPLPPFCCFTALPSPSLPTPFLSFS